jgi:hypothetical protein
MAGMEEMAVTAVTDISTAALLVVVPEGVVVEERVEMDT